MKLSNNDLQIVKKLRSFAFQSEPTNSCSSDGRIEYGVLEQLARLVATDHKEVTIIADNLSHVLTNSFPALPHHSSIEEVRDLFHTSLEHNEFLEFAAMIRKLRSVPLRSSTYTVLLGDWIAIILRKIFSSSLSSGSGQSRIEVEEYLKYLIRLRLGPNSSKESNTTQLISGDNSTIRSRELGLGFALLIGAGIAFATGNPILGVVLFVAAVTKL